MKENSKCKCFNVAVLLLFWVIFLYFNQNIIWLLVFIFRYRREQAEIDRLHGMTEEERRLEMKLKPKVLLNKASKGKYKFLQKYYHRGVFFLVSFVLINWAIWLYV